MRQKSIIHSFILALHACFTVFYAQAMERPNIVLILADDLGWQDVGCYDLDEPTPMETPNIDSLAQKGVLFRQGYSRLPLVHPPVVPS